MYLDMGGSDFLRDENEKLAQANRDMEGLLSGMQEVRSEPGAALLFAGGPTIQRWGCCSRCGMIVVIACPPLTFLAVPGPHVVDTGELGGPEAHAPKRVQEPNRDDRDS